MKFEKALIWSYVHEQQHPLLNEEECTIGGSRFLINTLFPGVSYPPISGFYELSENCIVPVLKKLFPELQFMRTENIRLGEEVEVVQFLPSDGYEWMDLEWKATFKRLLSMSAI